MSTARYSLLDRRNWDILQLNIYPIKEICTV